MELRLSRHFVDNWRVRVWNEPSVSGIKSIIYDSIKVQDGKNFGHAKTLSYYWHPELKLILSIDHFTGTAVSVLSEANKPSKTKPKKTVKFRQHAGYVPMTMHAAGM